MLFRFKIIIAYTILFLASSLNSLYAGDYGFDDDLLPDFISDIQYYSCYKELPVDSIKNLPESSFNEFDHHTIETNEDFWLRIKIDNQLAKYPEYVIHFFSLQEQVYLYQENEKGEWIEAKSGVMLPEEIKTLKGFIKDKTPFSISDGDETVLYFKLLNRVHSRQLEIADVIITDSGSFNHTFSLTKQLQSFFLGIVAILCFLNLLLFIFTGGRIHLYYLLYAIFASIYFIHFFRYFESGFFVNYPEINIYFFFSASLIQVIYCWFLYEALKTEVGESTLRNVKRYAIFVSASTFVFIVISLFNFRTGVLISDIYSIINSIYIFTITILLFKRVSNTIKVIFLGSVFLVIGGSLTVIYNFEKDIPMHVYLFQAGFFIELIFFTIAINIMHQNARLSKLNTELKNAVLQNEKLNKEKEAQLLLEQVQQKERDLATKAVVISQKEMLIKNVTSQLEKQVENNSVKIKDIKSVVSSLNSKVGNNFWGEFETHFINVHPEFYNSLNNLYPGLTNNERRLCAFIKLNLTTKEIANITKRNPESIHMTRSRIRKKMGLKKSDNIENVISAIT